MKPKGFALIEVLVSSFLMAVCISGLAALWVYCLNQIQDSRELSIVGQLARGEVECAKVNGFPRLPQGSYRSDTRDAVWSGSFDRLGNSGKGRWISGADSFYDVNGQPTTGVATYSIRSELRDTDINVSTSGSNYELGLAARRTLTVTVKRLPEGKVVFRMATEFAKGGL
jgi:Tfp pilus assembly protein PilV